MNRRDRRARDSRERHATPAYRTPRHVAERAEKEGFALFEVTGENWEKIKDIQARLLNVLDECSVVDGFFAMTRLNALIAAFGFQSQIDSCQFMSRDAFLKNCAEQYDGFARSKLARDTAVNAGGGDT